MSKLGSLYLRLGEPEGETHGCCELSDWAADMIEQQAKEIEALQSVSKEMARVGMQQRNDLAHAREQIEALRLALQEIAEWTDRYTSPNHPVSTVAKRALTGQ